MKIVIIGGVAGGATAAARLRRLSEETQIVIFEKDQYISYANCGLPYYIGGVIKNQSDLLVQTDEGMSRRFNLDIRIKTEITQINKERKTVTAKNLQSGEIYEESYEKLILSCGAKPVMPPIKGIEGSKVFVLRNIPDTLKIKEFVSGGSVKSVVVIGGGFIGVEMAENLTELGIKVTLVEKMRQVLRTLDFEMAQIVHTELELKGIDLILGDGIASFEGQKVVLESGKTIDTDMTILAIGVTPENALAKQANLETGKRGHLKVSKTFNPYTNGEINDDIFAVGDMIEVINPLDDTPYAVSLAWGANRQGRILADHIMGIEIKESKILGANALKVFSLTVASVGANESVLNEKNIPYTVVHAHRSNHAGYYPNAKNITLKLLFNLETGRIYGAQGVGGEGTEKRIDVISTVMRLNGTAYDLSDLELCYAPPYSSAKDPVNILGYIAENVKKNTYKLVRHDEIEEVVKKGNYFLDVRTPFEYNNGHIEGSYNFELDALRNNLDKMPQDKEAPLYVTCQAGLRAYLAVNILRGAGYKNVYNLSGGYATFKTFKHQTGKNKILTVNREGNDMQNTVTDKAANREIDVAGLQCPGPLMATYKALNEMKEGETLCVTATDGGFVKDVESWCQTNGHTLLEMKSEKDRYIAKIQKGVKAQNSVAGEQKNATIVLFSGALDKALAAMIIAQGAAAQGKNVTIFYTFWGLNALRKDKAVKVSKTGMEKMFGAMMPRGAARLPLSNMNMAGMGSKMIKGIMKKKNVDDLPTMIKKAQEAGVKMIACTMSMDLMGIKAEEFIDGVEFAGVATYISRNENVGTTLFI